MGRISILAALCLALSACANSGPVTGTTETLRAPVDPETTTSQPVVPEQPPSLVWSSVELDFGVSQITQVGSGLVGLAVQDFEAPSSLIEEGDTGCVGFQAGRTGEVVWSPDGVTWEPLPAQPYWYQGVLSPEEWGAIIRSGGIPANAALVELVARGERLLAVSFAELTEAEASVVVDIYEPSTSRWVRLGSLGSVGVNRSAVAAASGPEGTVIVATGRARDLAVWTVGEAELTELTDPFDGLTVAGDERWAAQVDGIELVATADGFIAQFEVADRSPLMAYSVDGTQWARVAHPSAGPVHLAAAESTVLGSNGDGMWISLDNGDSWQAVHLEQAASFVDLRGTPTGFTAWMFEETWVSPTVWYSRDGVDWEPVLELSEKYTWINGVVMTAEVIVVSVGVPSGGWVCPEIEGSGYEIYRGAFER